MQFAHSEWRKGDWDPSLLKGFHGRSFYLHETLHVIIAKKASPRESECKASNSCKRIPPRSETGFQPLAITNQRYDVKFSLLGWLNAEQISGSPALHLRQIQPSSPSLRSPHCCLKTHSPAREMVAPVSTVLVTGATGFVALEVVKQLLEKVCNIAYGSLAFTVTLWGQLKHVGGPICSACRNCVCVIQLV